MIDSKELTQPEIDAWLTPKDYALYDGYGIWRAVFYGKEFQYGYDDSIIVLVNNGG